MKLDSGLDVYLRRYGAQKNYTWRSMLKLCSSRANDTWRVNIELEVSIEELWHKIGIYCTFALYTTAINWISCSSLTLISVSQGS